MEEVTSNMTILVMIDYHAGHEVEYSGRKDPIFDECLWLRTEDRASSRQRKKPGFRLEANTSFGTHRRANE